MNEKKTIGRIDMLDFPGLGLENLPVKVDTGAYTSCIHSSEIKEIEVEGEPVLSFHLLDPDHENYTGKQLLSTDFSKSMVKSSSGHLEERYVITTLVVIEDTTYVVELSLSDRTDMRFPVLIGRKLLWNNFTVDVTKKNVSFNSKIPVLK